MSSVLGSLIPVGYQIFYNPTGGAAVSGGSLYSYQAGTTTPQATYTDATLDTANTNPVVLDSNGGANVWFPVTTGYKFVLEDSNGNVLWTRDQVYAIPPGSVGTQQIADGAIGTSELASGCVTGGSSGIIALGTITAANIATGAITGGSGGLIASSTIEDVNLDPEIDFSTLDRTLEVVWRNKYDLTGMRLEIIPQYPWTSPVLLNNPGTLPAGSGMGCAFSPCGNFLAVGVSGDTPALAVYERAGTNFNLLGTPGTLPAGGVNQVKWSPNGDFLACGGGGSTPYLTIYQRQGNVLTKLSNPGTLPGSNVDDLAWSPNGEYLLVVCGGSSSPLSAIYQVTGTTFTYFSSNAPSGGGSSESYLFNSCCWTPDSQYCLLTNTGGELINAYQRVASVFNSISAPELPADTVASLHAMAFSPDQQILAIGLNASPYISLWSFSSSGVFTTIGTPSTLPSSQVNSLAWSSNGAYLALALSSSPYIMVYERSGTTFTAMGTPGNTPTSAAYSISWSPTGEFLALGIDDSPFINIYQTGTTSLPTDAILWMRSPNV